MAGAGVAGGLVSTGPRARGRPRTLLADSPAATGSGALSTLPAAVNRTAQLAALLAEEIRSRKYRPGDRLPTEQQMVAHFGVSRTVVREAVASLRAEGLVVARQGAGLFVAHVTQSAPFRIDPQELSSVDELLHVLQLRLAVEVEAAGMAAANRTAAGLVRLGRALDRIEEALHAGHPGVEEDLQFHVAIAAVSGNPQFERFMQFIAAITIPSRLVMVLTRVPDAKLRYMRPLQVEHAAILNAIRTGNVEAARRHARIHLERARTRFTQLAAEPY